MSGADQRISFAEACARVTGAVRVLRPPRAETVPLADALGRLLADDLYAPEPQPALALSAMDGIAVAWRDGVGAWDLVGEVAAGQLSIASLPGCGAALTIMTGAPLAAGADTVIPLEDLVQEGARVFLKPGSKVVRAQYVRQPGSEIAGGQIILRRGTCLVPGRIALAAACGFATVAVFNRLKIGVLATGSELVPVAEAPAPGRIRASNLAALLALVVQMGHEPLDLGLIGDDPDVLRARLSAIFGSGDCDILLTTGGVCNGKYDLLPEISAQLGVRQLFWQVRMKPGKSILLGANAGGAGPTLWFGLPGNPVAVMVTAQLFLQQLLTAYYGVPHQTSRQALVTADIAAGAVRLFLRGHLSYGPDGSHRVTPLDIQSSADLVGFAAADCLIDLPPDSQIKAGEVVTCIMI